MCGAGKIKQNTYWRRQRASPPPHDGELHFPLYHTYQDQQQAAMLRPASRYARRRCSSIYSSTPVAPHRTQSSTLKRSLQLGGLRAPDRHVGQQSTPFALGSTRRVLLSTASGRGSETAKDAGEMAAVHGTQDDANETDDPKASVWSVRSMVLLLMNIEGLMTHKRM